MTTVACEGVYWWRSNSYDLHSSHELPAALRPHLRYRHLACTPTPTRVKKTISDSTCYGNTLISDTVPIPSHYYQSYLSLVSVSPKYSSTQHTTKRAVKLLSGKEVEVVVPARTRMHAQVTSEGSLNVNTVDEISLPRKLSSATPPPPPPPLSLPVDINKPALSSPLSNTYHQQQINRVPSSYSASSSSSSCPHTPTNLTYQDNYNNQAAVSVTSTNANTTVGASPRTLSTSTNAIADSANQNNCSGWVLKNFTKLSSSSNSSSRGSVAAKNKGGCIRRRLTDEEGYIRRAACICVNKEETKVGLILCLEFN